MTNKALIPVLVFFMLLTGVANTLLTKYQDMQCVRNCEASNPKDRQNFEQPVWQTAQMFVGEMGCWLVVAVGALMKRLTSRNKSRDSVEYQPVSSVDRDEQDISNHASTSRDGTHEDDSEEDQVEDPLSKPLQPTPHDQPNLPLQGWRVLLLGLPTACDLTGTTLMNVGLLFVVASIYQMTRGALVLFVGLFSVLFLRRFLAAFKWLGLFLVVAGVAIVGLAGVVERKNFIPALPPSDDPSINLYNTRAPPPPRDDGSDGHGPADDAALRTILGILLIFLAQVFTASQFVLEEAIMRRYTCSPLVVVGWEGTFGLIFTIVLQVVLHYTYGVTEKGQGGYFDASTGWDEITSHRQIAITSILIMISIGAFNFFGLSVTRSVSATSRSTIDTCRTLFIWIVSLGLGWENFKWLQVLGFALLVYGTFLFNEIVRPPMKWFSNGAEWWRTRRRRREELLQERSIERAR